MIDWLTVRVPSDYSVRNGYVISVNADGNTEWEAPKRLQVPGSFSSSVSVRRAHDGLLEISGNPSKFMQGHNLFGTSDLLPLATAFVLQVHSCLGHRLLPGDLSSLEAGRYALSRIDVNRAWTFGTLPRATAAVASLSHYATLQNRGRGSLIAEGTAMWGKGSRRWSCKAYAKKHELNAKGHGLPHQIPEYERLMEYAEGLVRVEFTVRSMELKARALDVPQNWGTLGVTPDSLFDELYSKLAISEASVIDTDMIENVPPRLRAVYQLWLDGHDLRTIYPARTFRRYRAQLKPFGVDIVSVQPRERSNVIPLRVVMTGQPVGVPDWAVGTKLYFEPKRAA